MKTAVELAPMADELAKAAIAAKATLDAAMAKYKTDGASPQEQGAIVTMAIPQDTSGILKAIYVRKGPGGGAAQEL